jgi:hypothetical protein
MGCAAECHFLRVLHEEVGDNKKQWWTCGHIVSLFIELATEAEVWGGWDMAEEPQDILRKMLTGDSWPP